MSLRQTQHSHTWQTKLIITYRNLDSGHQGLPVIFDVSSKDIEKILFARHLIHSYMSSTSSNSLKFLGANEGMMLVSWYRFFTEWLKKDLNWGQFVWIGMNRRTVKSPPADHILHKWKRVDSVLSAHEHIQYVCTLHTLQKPLMAHQKTQGRGCVKHYHYLHLQARPFIIRTP